METLPRGTLAAAAEPPYDPGRWKRAVRRAHALAQAGVPSVGVSLEGVSALFNPSPSVGSSSDWLVPLLQSGCSPSCIEHSADGATVLSSAVSLLDAAAVECLLAFGARPHEGPESQQPWYRAIARQTQKPAFQLRQLAVLKALLQAGANPNSVFETGVPLTSSERRTSDRPLALTRSFEVVRILLDHGANPACPDVRNGVELDYPVWFTLDQALHEEDFRKVWGAYAAAGVDPAQTDGRGRGFVHHLLHRLAHGHYLDAGGAYLPGEKMPVFLDAWSTVSPDWWLPDHRGFTPLHLAMVRYPDGEAPVYGTDNQRLHLGRVSTTQAESDRSMPAGFPPSWDAIAAFLERAGVHGYLLQTHAGETIRDLACRQKNQWLGLSGGQNWVRTWESVIERLDAWACSSRLERTLAAGTRPDLSGEHDAPPPIRPRRARM